MRNAFHQAAITADGKDVVIEELLRWRVVTRGKELTGDGHADRITQSLTERAGGCFDTGRHAKLWMSRAARTHLAEVSNVIKRHREATSWCTGSVRIDHTREVQERIEQHACVAIREDKSITVGPVRRSGVIVERVLPQRISHGRKTHRRAGMPAVGGLDGIHGQRANGGDRQSIDERDVSGGTGDWVDGRNGSWCGRGGHSRRLPRREFASGMRGNGLVLGWAEASRLRTGPDATRFRTGPHSPYEDGR